MLMKTGKVTPRTVVLVAPLVLALVAVMSLRASAHPCFAGGTIGFE